MIMNTTITGGSGDIKTTWVEVGNMYSPRQVAKVNPTGSRLSLVAPGVAATYSATTTTQRQVCSSGDNVLILVGGGADYSNFYKAIYTSSTGTIYPYATSITDNFGHENIGGYLNIPIVVASTSSTDTDRLFIKDSVENRWITADEYSQLWLRVSMSGTSSRGYVYVGENQATVYYNNSGGTLRLLYDDSREMQYVA